MFQLAHPWLLLLLGLPLLAWRFLPAYRERQKAIRGPFLEQIAAATGKTAERGAVVMKRSGLQRFVAPLVYVLLVVAATKPELVEDPIVKTVSARDLMLAVDLSGSMEAEDFTDAEGGKLTRLDATKLVLEDFIAKREHDRMGLIVFGNAAYLQAPFTQDHETLRILLDQTRVRMAGPQTMLGDAIGFAISRFDESESTNRVLVLLTDGNDTGSKMPPAKAAEIAAKRDITIHTVAVGDPTTVGEEAMDLEALQGIADTTGGTLAQAKDLEELQASYAALDALEPGLFETLSWRPRRPLFAAFLAAAMLLLLAYEAWMLLRSRASRTGRAAHA